jgi:hypothetical protein
MQDSFDIALTNLRDSLDFMVQRDNLNADSRRKIRAALVDLRRVYKASQSTPKASPLLVEALADLEHEQWMYWSKALAQEVVVPQHKLDRWTPLWIPYRDLPEASKEQDRVWARKVLVVLFTAGILQK